MIRYLLDENLSPRIKLAILRLNSKVDVMRVGDPEMPALGTSDPELLRYLELSQRILVTDNRKSMPQHLEAHWAEGRSIWGLFWLRPKVTIRELAQDLILIWETTEVEEWQDQVAWIPL